MEGEFAMLCLLSIFVFVGVRMQEERRIREVLKTLMRVQQHRKRSRKDQKVDVGLIFLSPAVCLSSLFVFVLLGANDNGNNSGSSRSSNNNNTTKKKKDNQTKCQNTKHTQTRFLCSVEVLVVFVPFFLSFSLSSARLFLEGVHVFLYELFVTVVNIATVEKGGKKLGSSLLLLYLCFVPVGSSFSFSLFLRSYTGNVMFACVCLCLSLLLAYYTGEGSIVRPSCFRA